MTTGSPAAPDELEFRLPNAFQRDFPSSPSPFAATADRIGMDENTVIEALRRLHETGSVSRVGAVFRPNAVGASALAALAV